MKHLRWVFVLAAVTAVGSAMAQTGAQGILKGNSTAFTGKTQTGDLTGNITTTPYPNLVGSSLTGSGSSAFKGNGSTSTGSGSTTTGSGVLTGGNNAFNAKGGSGSSSTTGTTSPAIKGETQLLEVTNLPMTAGDLPQAAEMNVPAQKCDTKPVPEPATMTILGIGALAAVLKRRKKAL